MHRSLPGLTILLLAGLFVSPARSQEKIQLTLLSGETKTVPSVSLDKGVIKAEGLADVPLDELLFLATQRRPLPPAKAPLSIDLSGGGRIAAQSLLMQDEKCQIVTLALDSFTLPLEALRGFHSDGGPHEGYAKALAAPSPKNDKIYLKVEDKIESVAGTLDSVAELEFSFDYDAGKRTMARDRLWGVVLSASPATEEPKSRVTFLDGSTVAGELVSIADGKLTLKLGRKGSVALPWDAVSTISLKSDRLTYLSDLKPTNEEQQTLVAFPLPWQKDRSVGGKPLTLGGKKFARGVGMHALCRLTYDLGGKYDELKSVVGIDGAMQGKGDCQFRIVADDVEVFARRMKGTDAPFELSLDVRGVKELILSAEPGEELDLADHADWADARLLRTSSKK